MCKKGQKVLNPGVVEPMHKGYKQEEVRGEKKKLEGRYINIGYWLYIFSLSLSYQRPRICRLPSRDQ